MEAKRCYRCDEQAIKPEFVVFCQPCFDHYSYWLGFEIEANRWFIDYGIEVSPNQLAEIYARYK